MDYDKSKIPSNYDAGREISRAVKYDQLEFFIKSLPINEVANIIDLGCGTGRYTSVLSEAFEAAVVGVDPSRKMLEQAQSKHQDSRISFKIASGEAIPAADGAVDMVFMSMVLHHLTSLESTALECGRALRCDGSVCVRNTVADEISSYPYLAFFPSIGTIIHKQLFSRKELIGEFAAAGFELAAHQTVWSEISADWSRFAGKIALRADSFVAQLEEREFEAGLSKLWAKAAGADLTEKVGLNVDSFIFRKR